MQVGSGEIFSSDEPLTNDDDFEVEDDDWQDLVKLLLFQFYLLVNDIDFVCNNQIIGKDLDVNSFFTSLDLLFVLSIGSK